ncbi:MAG: 1,2-phenylacetyl-CoA epoxidase subunit PaaD [Vibrio sp.]
MEVQVVTSISEPEIHRIWQLVSDIPDPEIPVISIGELGIIRKVEHLDNHWKIVFTPTYSGCPATEMLIEDITKTMADEGYNDVDVVIQLDPAWTTDWINDATKEKLRQYGIAPPDHKACMHTAINAHPACPRCKSENTKLVSEFGSTACKAHFQCNECQEPFDYFKCI